MRGHFASAEIERSFPETDFLLANDQVVFRRVRLKCRRAHCQFATGAATAPDQPAGRQRYEADRRPTREPATGLPARPETGAGTALGQPAGRWRAESPSLIGVRRERPGACATIGRTGGFMKRIAFGVLLAVALGGYGQESPPTKVSPAETRVRMALKPAARAALDRADRRNAANDSAGALEAYMEAVRIDPAAASLDRIRDYSPLPSFRLVDPLPPAEQRAADERFVKGEKAHAAALRQYVDLHPDDWQTRKALVHLVPLADAQAMLAPLFKARPNDPELYDLRGSVRAHAGEFDASLADYVKAAELDPRNPERKYIAGVVIYQTVAKRPGLTPQQKRDLIRRGIAYLEAAEGLKPEYFEAMAYRNLLLRQMAELESDPETKKKLVAEADEVRRQAVEAIQRRKEQRARP
jgi:tetratricopeptide (TPR) repeat protein